MTARPIDTNRRCLLLFPGALGDFLCFLPTADALKEKLAASTTIATHPAYGSLVDGPRFQIIDIERREVAGLFSSEPPPNTKDLLDGFDQILSWTGANDRNFRRNLRAITAGETEVFAFDDFHTGEHAVDRFARNAGVTVGRARISITEDARTWARDEAAKIRVDSGTLFIHPGSGSPGKSWQGMDALAARWRHRGGNVVSIIGPADHELETVDATIRDEPLDRIAALLEIAPFFVGNDSGISHLAGAASCPGLALFANSDPSIWRPQSDTIEVPNASIPCDRCGPDQFCTHRLSVEHVLHEVDRHRSETYRLPA